MQETVDEKDKSPQQNLDDEYLLAGLMRKVHTSDPEKFLLTLGVSPASLGTDFKNPDVLSGKRPMLDSTLPVYVNSEAESERRVFETHDGRMGHLVPQCYYLGLGPCALKLHGASNLPILTNLLRNVKLDTLLYSFYCMTKEPLQGLAACELNKRGWLYNKKFKKWFLAQPSDTDPGAPRPIQYFEPQIWKFCETTQILDQNDIQNINEPKRALEIAIQRLKEETRWLNRTPKPQESSHQLRPNMMPHPGTAPVGYPAPQQQYYQTQQEHLRYLQSERAPTTYPHYMHRAPAPPMYATQTQQSEYVPPSVAGGWAPMPRQKLPPKPEPEYLPPGKPRPVPQSKALAGLSPGSAVYK